MIFNTYNQITKVTISSEAIFTNDMVGMFQNMRNLKSVEIANEAFDQVKDMSNAFYFCNNLTDSPKCGNNVTNMSYAYCGCMNLTGNPVCGEKVTNMCMLYEGCYELTGQPVCGKNVTDMGHAYGLCSGLTGSPVCGENVTDMYSAYFGCRNLTGSPVCGEKVNHMGTTYSSCTNLTGSPICGNNVTNMWSTYTNSGCCKGNAYFYSPNVSNVTNCFYHNTVDMINIYVPVNSVTLNTCLSTDTNSLRGSAITWTNDTANNRYYNTAQNLYIYPVANVAESRAANGD